MKTHITTHGNRDDMAVKKEQTELEAFVLKVLKRDVLVYERLSKI